MKKVKRSKKRDERNVSDPFTKLTSDLNVEILMKLPPRSIARLHFASKHLSSIILDKEFTELYMTRSSTQPRHLVSVNGGHSYMKIQRFHSIPQEYPSPSNHNKVSCELDPYGPNRKYEFTPPVRGLICGRNGIKIKVGNPSTGQFVSLPRVKTTKKDILCVFGYDPVNDVYKVLCMTLVTKRSNISRGVKPCDAMSEEHQVITLGRKEKWRMIECKYPHRFLNKKDPHSPYSGYHQGICRDGVMYYLASYKQKRSLVSFDLSSEDFNVTKLPEAQILQQFGELVNHAGKITLATLLCNGPLNLWVLEDVKKEVWSKAVVVVPSPADIFGRDHTYEFRGILGTGEIIFTLIPSSNPFCFLCYNPKGGNFRTIGIGETVGGYDTIQVFFDHVESCMVL